MAEPELQRSGEGVWPISRPFANCKAREPTSAKTVGTCGESFSRGQAWQGGGPKAQRPPDSGKADIIGLRVQN